MPGPKRVRTGEQLQGLPGDSWNAFVDTTEKFAQLQRAFAGTGQSSGAQRLTVACENTTGSLIDTDFPVLEIDGPIYNATDRTNVVFEGVALKGKTPTASANMSDIVIVQGPIAASGSRSFRQAVMVGPTWCSLNVLDAAHTHVQPKVGDNTQLESASSGSVKIIWKEAGTGTKKALIILGGGGGAAENVRIGVTHAGGLSARSGNVLGQGTVDRYTSTARPNISDTGEDDTVYNIVATPVGGLKYIVYARDVDGTWIVIVEDCT